MQGHWGEAACGYSDAPPNPPILVMELVVGQIPVVGGFQVKGKWGLARKARHHTAGGAQAVGVLRTGSRTIRRSSLGSHSNAELSGVQGPSRGPVLSLPSDGGC